MSDSKASVKISFSIYGKDFKQEWWINWQDSDGRGMDERVAQWFEECYHKAYAAYQAMIVEDAYAAYQAENAVCPSVDDWQAIAQVWRAMYEAAVKPSPQSQTPPE